MTSILVFLFLSFVAFASVNSQEVNVKYDSVLAKKLGADDYGMKNYTFVILKSGINKESDTKIIDSIFTGHLQNINRLANEGLLVLARPFGKNENNLRGIFVFNVENADEVRSLLATDPAINANFLEAEIYPWYGSASLEEIINIHDKIYKYKF